MVFVLEYFHSVYILIIKYNKKYTNQNYFV